MPRLVRFLAIALFALPLRAADKPNILFILADDLGYGDLGCYGQQHVSTPNIDHLAAEGLRFTQFYAGAPVCAPSRAVLMTGKHVGHVSVRGNAGGKIGDLASTGPQTLKRAETTVAEMLKKAGYATALIGKWGLGELGSGSEPTQRGFDFFYGYLNQHHAHNYYPAFLIRNESPVGLKNEVPGEGPFGIGYASKKVEYSPDLFADQAVRWIEANKSGPFFLYLALTLPHANNEANRDLKNGTEVPDLGTYAAKQDWTEPNKGQAAMIAHLDHDVGRILALLKTLGLDDHTLVIFTSDNGPHREASNDPAFFNASGGLHGIKRDLYEGGIRVPFIARWTGYIAPGTTSTHVGYFGDVMSTLAELSGATAPAGIDSLSFVPALRGQPQSKHDALYWEFHEGATKQAVLLDQHWKGVRLHPGAPLELYDLTTDADESDDLSKTQPAIAKRVEELLKTSRSENPNWPIREASAAKKKVPKP